MASGLFRRFPANKSSRNNKQVNPAAVRQTAAPLLPYLQAQSFTSSGFQQHVAASQEGFTLPPFSSEMLISV